MRPPGGGPDAQPPHSGLFTSPRERRLWGYAAAVVLGIWSTLGLAGRLAGFLRRRELLDASFAAGLAVLAAALAAGVLRRRPGRRELWAAAGLAAVCGMAVVRMGISPEERTHLIEYGLLAGLLHEALLERERNGRGIRFPAAVAVGLAAALGWIDEGIQAVLPSRVYDIRDVGFNALAALIAVLGRLALERARRGDLRRSSRQ